MIDFNAITQTKAFARQDGVIACFLHPSLCSVAND